MRRGWFAQKCSPSIFFRVRNIRYLFFETRDANPHLFLRGTRGRGNSSCFRRAPTVTCAECQLRAWRKYREVKMLRKWQRNRRCLCCDRYRITCRSGMGKQGKRNAAWQERTLTTVRKQKETFRVHLLYAQSPCYSISGLQRHPKHSPERVCHWNVSAAHACVTGAKGVLPGAGQQQRFITQNLSGCCCPYRTVFFFCFFFSWLSPMLCWASAWDCGSDFENSCWELASPWRFVADCFRGSAERRKCHMQNVMCTRAHALCDWGAAQMSHRVHDWKAFYSF